jgi:RNA polymerase sigma-70 factor (ECF subfamily)
VRRDGLESAGRARASPDTLAAVTLDDQEVVRSLLAGEAGAWDLLVERYAALVSACVRRVLLGRGLRPDQADVDDLAENVFVMLLEQDMHLLRRYDARYKLSAYLAVIARTAAHRWLRRQKAKVDLPDEAWGEAVPDADALTISEETTHKEVCGAVRTTLDGLSEREQRVLRLYYYESQDYQQIADALAISVNSVGAALTRARTKLHEALKRHEDLSESDFRSV